MESFYSIGLFGFMYSAIIRNLGVTNVNITGHTRVGGLAGFAADSYISSSYSTGNVTGNRLVGGLVGSASSGSIISNSYSSGTVTSDRIVGGLVGSASSGLIISNSYSRGTVTGERMRVGGLVGNASFGSTISNSYSESSVTGDEDVGGLVGRAFRSTISSSYSTGSVTGNESAGGLVGSADDSTIRNCYSSGVVTADSRLGGLIGYASEAEINNNYWDIQTSGVYSSAGGEGRTTEQMTYPYCEETYVGWDFADIWGSDDDYWVNNGYPYLQWQINLFPKTAVNPVPEDDSEDISVLLEELKWSFYPDSAYVDPAGFRVYFSETPDFAEASFSWVYYHAEKIEFFCYEILPEELAYNTVYYWQVIPTTKEEGTGEGEDAVNCPVWSFTTEIDTSVDPEGAQPFVTELLGNHPNPFNPETVIRFTVGKDEQVSLAVYNVRGQLVRTLHNGFLAAGEYSLNWDGKDSHNRHAASGIYLYRLEAGDYAAVRRMILMK